MKYMYKKGLDPEGLLTRWGGGGTESQRLEPIAQAATYVSENAFQAI